MTMMKDDHLVMLGHIKGQLEGIQKEQVAQGVTLTKVDGRLRHVERKSAMIGAGSGGIISVGIAVIIETIKHKSGFGGS